MQGRRRLFMLLMGLIILCVLVLGAGLGLLVWAETHPAPVGEDSQAIVVLGAQVYQDGSLSPQLELRMEAALSEYRRMPRRIICCGGQGEKEPAPEGDVMKAWLIQRGVPEMDVFSENTSENTTQNLRYAAQFLPEGEKRITVITSDYHLPRALQMARDEGYRADGVGSPCKPEYWVKNHLRETFAWGKYLLSRLGIMDYQ